MLRRADALVILIDLSKDALAQMEEVLKYLAEMRISIGVGVVDPESIIVNKKVLVAGTKLDMPGAPENLVKLKEKYGQQLPVLGISVLDGSGLEELAQTIYQVLGIIRVYTKAPGEKAVYEDPIVVPRGSTLEEAAAVVHKDFAAKLKFARVWGSGKHDGIAVKRDHVLQDGDVIELHI
jgi:ribosome-interacting GTPase 1